MYNENKPLLKRGIKPGFWRPPTDNDIGGKFDKTRRAWLSASNHRQIEHVYHNMNRRTASDVAFEFVSLSRLVLPVPAMFNASYTVYHTGDIHVTGALLFTSGVSGFISETGEVCDSIPRFGWDLGLIKEYNKVEWYGKGPHETYWDRQVGAKVGIHKNSVSDMFFPYVRPQETGNHVETRWTKITSEGGNGLLVTCDDLGSLFHFSALHYELETLTANSPSYKRHSSLLNEDDITMLRVDKLQMGLGGVNSWGKTANPKYLIPVANNHFSFWIRSITHGDSLEDVLKHRP
eukprot:m.40838 g.40838  ORF g.40838 m.40838 type:complete len:291 (+) comp9715_c0_seq1:3378-4250(+)